MAYKLIDAAQVRWRAVNTPHLVALVRAGAVFHKGKLLERPIDITRPNRPNQPERSTAGVSAPVRVWINVASNSRSTSGWVVVESLGQPGPVDIVGRSHRVNSFA